VNEKYILGCTFFSNLLSTCAIFSQVLQHNNLLRTMQELNKLSSKSPQHWHTYSATLKSITEEDGSKVYQQQPLQHFAEAE